MIFLEKPFVFWKILMCFRINERDNNLLKAYLRLRRNIVEKI